MKEQPTNGKVIVVDHIDRRITTKNTSENGKSGGGNVDLWVGFNKNPY